MSSEGAQNAHGFPKQILRLLDLLSRNGSHPLPAGDAIRSDVQLAAFVPAGKSTNFAGRANVRAAGEHGIERHIAVFEGLVAGFQAVLLENPALRRPSRRIGMSRVQVSLRFTSYS